DRSYQGYIALTQSLILNYGLRDKVILMGRGGNFLFKGIPYVLRIRTFLPLEERIKRTTREREISQDTAQWLVNKADSEMARAVYLIYGKKWDDPAEYDLVLDLQSGTEETLTRTVSDLLEQKEKAATAEARQVLHLRALAAKVKAGIVADPQFLVPTLDVEVVGDKLVLRGVIHNPQEHQKIEEEAKKLAGTVPIKCELHYRGLKGK
ncbi:MAG: BON domain-containing protein, partial [Desulfobacteraceae bacterium]